MSQQKHLVDPENNELRIGARSNAKTLFFISKIYLKKFSNLELHALGDALQIAVKLADKLQRQGLATIQKIDTHSTQLEQGRKIKMIVKLSITEDGRKRIDEEIKQ